jgi:hypothetical protein
MVTQLVLVGEVSKGWQGTHQSNQMFDPDRQIAQAAAGGAIDRIRAFDGSTADRHDTRGAFSDKN